MTKKRILEDGRILKDNRSVEQFAMDNCKVLVDAVAERVEIHTCKTCNKQFSSFQALGGHRTSHKRRLPRISAASVDGEKDPEKVLGVGAATSSRSGKIYRCYICGQEYPVAQALGGHMRWHRVGGREAAAVAVGGDSGTRSQCSSETASENRNRVTWDLNLTSDENCLTDSN